MSTKRGSFITGIDRLLADINNSASLEELVSLAKCSSNGLKTVTKMAIHYSVLGNEKRSSNLEKLLLELSRLEDERPELAWQQNVASTLVITLDGKLLKHRKGEPLNEMEATQHRIRREVAMRIIEQIAERNPLKVVGPLLASLGSEINLFSDRVDELLYKLREKHFGKVQLSVLRKFIGSAAYSLRDSRWRHAYYYIKKVIEGGNNDLIDFVRPLFDALRDIEDKDLVKDLLARMSMQKLGKPDSEVQAELRTVLSRREEDATFSIGYLKKIRREEEIELDTRGDNSNRRYEGPRLMEKGPGKIRRRPNPNRLHNR